MKRKIMFIIAIVSMAFPAFGYVSEVGDKVHLRSGIGFSPPVGAIVEIESGEIL